MKRSFGRAFWVFFLISLAALAGFIAFALKVERQSTIPGQQADGMIVLTGSADRIPDAIELFSKGHARRLLITGVHPGITRVEIGHLSPKFRDLINCCMDLGYEAMNTFGNAREARRWVEQHEIEKSIIVVTSNYHMPRALAELHDALPQFTLIPYPVVSIRMREVGWWQSTQTLRLIGTEYVKYVLVSGRIAARKLWALIKPILN